MPAAGLSVPQQGAETRNAAEPAQHPQNDDFHTGQFTAEQGVEVGVMLQRLQVDAVGTWKIRRNCVRAWCKIPRSLGACVSKAIRTGVALTAEDISTLFIFFGHHVAAAETMEISSLTSWPPTRCSTTTRSIAAAS